MPNLKPLTSLEPLKSAPLQPVPLKSAPLKPPPLKPWKELAANQVWDLQAAIGVLQSDKDFDGQLNPEEYKSVSLVQGDGYFASRARDYEFAAVDEIKLSDGKVSMSELATFYQEIDTDKDGKHSQPEFENRLNRTSWLTRLRNPIASFTHIISQYTSLVKNSFGWA
ncbi:MAG TPA: hypothetical protein V6D23_15315 [Candidatus Obscuribacterales bacterium]